MKESRVIITAMAVTVWAGCGDAPVSDVQTATGATTSASTCQAKTDSSGPYQQYTASLTRRIKQAKHPDRVITIDLTQIDRWFGGTTEELDLVLKLNGGPLFQSSVYRYTGEIDFLQNYYPPYQGISWTQSAIVDGTLFAVADGRNVLPTPATSPPTIQYQDGLPAPNVTLDPDVQSAMVDLLSSTTTAASQCVANDTRLADPSQIPAPNPAPHLSDTRSNLGCIGCRAVCATAWVSCLYGTLTSVACGPFALFCAAVGAGICTGARPYA